MRSGAKRTTQIMKNIGARETINSGASKNDNDANWDLTCLIGYSLYKGISIEVKVTDKKGFTVTAELLTKIKNEALQSWRLPLLLIDIKQGDKTCVVLSLNDFKDILNRLEYLENEHKKREG